MKKYFLFIISFVVSNYCLAQISIDQSDMPIANDSTVRVNATNAATLNFATTGANTVWDFSTLAYTTSNTDNYSDIASAPIFTQIVFNNPFNSNSKSQIFITGQSPLQLPNNPLLPFTIGNNLQYYKKTTSRYARTGYSLNLNGIDLPLPFDSNDIEYRLPMNFGNADSCLSVFQINSQFLSFLYYKSRQKRVNHVDGWGKLKLPNGFEYDVLRIKSELFTVDTFHIDTFISFGAQLPMRKTIEYKWLAKGLQAPILVATGLEVAGNFTPTTVRYLNKVATAVYNVNCKNNTWFVGNNNNNQLLINNADVKSVSVIDINGKSLATFSCNQQNAMQSIPIQSLPIGIYVLKANFINSKYETIKFIKN